MEHLIKNTTLIDTLGMLLPGSVLVLMVNFYGVIDVGAPWKALFSGEDFSLLIYMLGISYIVGCIIHQMGSKWDAWRVEHIVRQSRNAKKTAKHTYHYEYWNPEKSTSEQVGKLLSCFQKIEPSAKKLPKDEKACVDYGKKIFRWVQQENRPQRLVYFSAAYSMYRNLAVVMIIVSGMAAILSAIALYENSINWRLFFHVVLGVLMARMFYCNWQHYERLAIKEAYMCFMHQMESKN